MEPFLVIVTGQPHRGKTSLVQKFIHEALKNQLHVAGILAIGKIENGRRSGFDIMDLASNTRIPLSRRFDILDKTAVPYRFYDEGLEAGRRALDPQACKHADIIVIDEVGPVELNGNGWADCLLPLLAMPGSKIHVWVINRNFIKGVCAKFGVVPRAVIDVRNKDAFDQLCDICMRYKGEKANA